MDIEQISNIVDEITYKPNWDIALYAIPISPEQYSLYIQLEVFNQIDSVTRKTTSWKSGKRYLSEFMCRQEIVGAVYGLIETAEIHEMREWFRYKGASIYNPHIDPDKLAELASKKENFNCRQNAMSMEENQ